MIHPYQLHSLSMIYREEALQQARVRNLTHQAKSHRRSHSEERGLWYRLGKLAAAAFGSS